jgi:hypothetical protein
MILRQGNTVEAIGPSDDGGWHKKTSSNLEEKELGAHYSCVLDQIIEIQCSECWLARIRYWLLSMWHHMGSR